MRQGVSMTIRNFILSFALVLSIPSFAQSNNQPGDQPVDSAYPTVNCPAVGQEYEKMVSKLDAIKTSIKDTANCKEVTMEVDSLQKLLDEDRTKVFEIVDSAKETGLTAEQSEFVKKYAEGLTKKVSGLNDLFMNSTQCFSEDATVKPIGALAGFVGEASSLIGSVSGPWGAPIALAGNLVAGFLTGLDEIFKKNAGFDFSQRNQWVNYVQNLCTYHSFRPQIDHLIDPVGRINQLNHLETVLNVQISQLQTTCSDCNKIVSLYTPNMDSASAIAATQSDVSAANMKYNRPYGSYTLQNLGLRDWVLKEIARLEREANGEWGNASGQYILTRTKEQIEDFLIRREAPNFLSFQTSQARTDYQDFVSFVNNEGRGLYNDLVRANKNAVADVIKSSWSVSPLAYFEALILNPVKWSTLPDNNNTVDLRYSWNHFRANSVLALRTAQTTARAALSFCAFFKRTDQYSSEIRAICSNDSFKKLVDQQLNLENQIKTAGMTDADFRPTNLNQYSLDDNRVFARNPLDALTKTIEMREIK